MGRQAAEGRCLRPPLLVQAREVEVGFGVARVELHRAPSGVACLGDGDGLEVDAFVCGDEASLLFPVNLGTIPFHAWSSRVASLAFSVRPLPGAPVSPPLS